MKEGIWKHLSIDEKYAMMDMLQKSVGEGQEIYIEAKIKGEDTQYYSVSQHTSGFRTIPEEQNVTSISILLNGDKLYEESRLLRYLLKNKGYLLMWLRNRAKQWQTKGMSKEEIDKTISILDGERLRSFSFDDTPQGYDFWIKIYNNAKSEEGE